MRRVILVFFIMCFSLGVTTSLWAKEPVIGAQAAVLIDAGTGRVLYGKNHKQYRPPASTTKMITAIIGIENGNLDDIIIISDRASQTGEASLNLVTGERITLKNLLYGALLRSGNDACVAIAEYTASTVEEFVALMNLKAQLLGCYDTNFVNTNGLPAKNHYSTAYDLAQIARYGLNNEIFAQIVSTANYTITWEESNRKRVIKNTNRLLTSYYGATGIKTGTTDEAGYCLVASAKKDNRNLIAVVLKSNNRFRDAEILLNYGFNNFRNINIIQKNKLINYPSSEFGKDLYFYTGNNLTITVSDKEKINITQELQLDIDKINNNVNVNEVVGRLKYLNSGLEVGSVPILTAQEIVKNKEPCNYWKIFSDN
ncbi:MAG: hypothetical protein JM58_13075 [Peptococcaceae bacterium BICA1-8]|nr:MAG: hypothetical protein JM58_13075 [Peptococcaceae bacterium BICA1-8]